MAHTAETKEQAVNHCRSGIPFWMVADEVKVSEASVRRWWERWNHSVRATEMTDIFNPGRRVWRICDRDKGTTVGPAYATKKEADAAIYEFL